ncbi:Hsp70 family protein, partial [bacterium]|nr:Hsp70 family protein [bacterium]
MRYSGTAFENLPSVEAAACRRCGAKNDDCRVVVVGHVGIETLGGVMSKLIQKNTTIPTKASQT